MFSFALIQPVWKFACLLAASSLFLSIAACGGGGGDGGGGTPPPAVPAQTIVSGAVQAPNGQVVFHQPGIGDFFEDLFISSAYASLSGVSSVLDGTAVQLGRMSSAGTVSVLASTTVSDGRYSFNLTSLGLTFTSDLAVRVANGPVQMRAFVTGGTVNLDPVSETAVRMILEQIAVSPETALSSFTPQELRDLVGALDLLTTTNQTPGGASIETTVTAIKQSATANTGLMAFLTAAARVGDTEEGPGDIGNYFSFTQGNVWRFQGTKSGTGQQQPVNFVNTAMITGTKTFAGGLTATVFTETDPDGNGQEEEDYRLKDSRGITNHGNNDATDLLTPQLTPFREVRFPLQQGATFESVNKTGVNFGDLDEDGRNDIGDVLAQVTVAAFETVTVPPGTFANSAKIEATITSTVTLSSDGTKVTVTSTQTDWLAPGVGPVKRQSQTSGPGLSESVTEELVGAVVNGQGRGLRIEVTPISSSVILGGTRQLTATLFDQGNSPVPGFSFIWTSNNPAVASVDSNGLVTGLTSGLINITASAVGITSNGAAVNVNDVRLVTLVTNDLIYDGGSQRIYASVPSSAGGIGNSITSINPVTGSIGSSVTVGSEPKKLAISDNGQFLYVGLDGTGAVRRFNLASQTAELQLSLGSDPFLGSYYADDVEVLPGNPRAVAIARKYKTVSPSAAGVVVYDDGVQRPATTPGHFQGSNVIEFSATAERLYGYNGETTAFAFHRMTVNASGVSLVDVFDSFRGDLISGFGVDIKFDGGRIYTTSGRVIDPEARTVVGTFSFPSTSGGILVKPDATIGRVLFLTRDGVIPETYSIRAFDRITLQQLGSLEIPGVSGTPSSLIRWGTKGLAFRTSGNQVFIVQDSSLIP